MRKLLPIVAVLVVAMAIYRSWAAFTGTHTTVELDEVRGVAEFMQKAPPSVQTQLLKGSPSLTEEEEAVARRLEASEHRLSVFFSDRSDRMRRLIAMTALDIKTDPRTAQTDNQLFAELSRRAKEVVAELAVVISTSRDEPQGITEGDRWGMLKVLLGVAESGDTATLAKLLTGESARPLPLGTADDPPAQRRCLDLIAFYFSIEPDQGRRLEWLRGALAAQTAPALIELLRGQIDRLSGATQ